MKIFFKIFAFAFGLLFVFSAVLQYNDPDPFIWILIYGTAAVVSFWFVWKSISFRVPLLLGIFGLMGFFYMFPKNFQGFAIGDGDIATVEEGREAFGLLIIALVMFAFVLRLRFVKKSKI